MSKKPHGPRRPIHKLFRRMHGAITLTSNRRSKMPRKAKKSAAPKPSSKVFGRAKGKLGSLTFADLNTLAKLVKNYKGALPAGYRKHCQICQMKVT